MTIVCGTDFSDNATAAVRSAAALAHKFSVRLDLVHVVHPALPALAELERTRVLAREIESTYGVPVEAHVESGSADEKLVEFATAHSARLLVVGSLGVRKQSRWLLGSVAERVAQYAPVPVLVVRQGERLERWAREDAPLRVMIGADRGSRSKEALRWGAALRAVGSCQLFVAEIVWPPEHYSQVGVSSPAPLDSLRPDLEITLVKALEGWAAEVIGPDDASFLVEPGWGRVDTHLTLLAKKHDVDLLVVGTHHRSGAARLWQGSVSRGVLHAAGMNVACVPPAPTPAEN